MKARLRWLVPSVALIATATLAATEVAIPEGSSAEEAMTHMAATGALASAYGAACAKSGIVVDPKFSKANLLRDIEYLVSLGFDRDELILAHQNLSGEKLGSLAVQYMVNRGVDLSDRSSICRSAVAEIEASTPVGNLLSVSN